MFPIFIYFSLTILSTIGFGDITPLTLQARYAAVAEGITGQFYLAILVARSGGDADEPNRSSVGEHSWRRSADEDPGPMIGDAVPHLNSASSRHRTRVILGTASSRAKLVPNVGVLLSIIPQMSSRGSLASLLGWLLLIRLSWLRSGIRSR